MDISEKFGFYLPASSDVADIQQIVENFRIIDEKAVSVDDGTTPEGALTAADVLSVISWSNYQENKKPVNTKAVLDYFQVLTSDFLDKTELGRMLADGEISASNILYNADPDNKVSTQEKLDELEASVGDISAVLDELHNYAQGLIGGAV